MEDYYIRYFNEICAVFAIMLCFFIKPLFMTKTLIYMKNKHQIDHCFQWHKITKIYLTKALPFLCQEKKHVWTQVSFSIFFLPLLCFFNRYQLPRVLQDKRSLSDAFGSKYTPNYNSSKYILILNQCRIIPRFVHKTL